MKLSYRTWSRTDKKAIHKFYILSSLFYFLLMASSYAQKSKSYSEDLSVLRPKTTPVENVTRIDSAMKTEKISITPTKNINAKVDAVLDSIDRFNQTRKFVDGYTILIYSGQKKEDAMESKKKVIEGASHLTANLQYQQPKFRVTVGKYYTRIEAQKDLVTLKQILPNATLIPEKIMIR